MTTSDPAVTANAFNAIAGLTEGFNASLASVLDKANQSTAATTAASGANLDKVLASLAPLAESKQTEGASGQNKTVLYIVVAIAIAIAAAFIFRKKS
ncbi:MAG: hypothetical protein H7X97_07095 [Opitutaceae bacterium]|nr:hypothetical protein [Verrucomicrobiales bacterium]